MPCLAQLMPAASSPSPSTLAARPVATSTTSATTCFSCPFCSKVTIACFLSSVATMLFTPLFILKLMPRFSNVLRKRFAISESIVGKHSFKNSMTVTELPNVSKAEANSSPITPAPMIAIVCGTWSISSNSVEVITLSFKGSPSGVSKAGINGSRRACEPVAIIILSAVICVPFTSITFLSTNFASPSI